MHVLKFGGTSVANAENISKVVAILKQKTEETQVVAVFSAFGGVTDSLLVVGELANKRNDSYISLFNEICERHFEAAKKLNLTESAIAHLKAELAQLKNILQGIYLINEFSDKTKDKVLAFCELLSTYIISERVKQDIENSVFKDSRDLIITNSEHTNAKVISGETDKRIATYFAAHPHNLTLMPGFVAKDLQGDITTLGRGGSDYTAAILAAALQAEILEIWTDVGGLYTANPKFVSQAFPIPAISYHEAMEISHFGAKVLFPPTIRPVLDKNIPILIKSTFDPKAEGTLISNKVNTSNGPVKGISHLPNITLLTLEGSGIVGVFGFSKRLFEGLSSERINVILITQASSEHSICVAVQDNDAQKAARIINETFQFEISLKTLDPVIVETDLSIIAVVGDNMKNHQGISGKMFSSLGKNNVNIRAIAQGASERNISAVIATKDVKKALNTLHYRFFERQVKVLNLFIVGVGNVGKRLLDQIAKQQAHIHENLFTNLKVVGICNSRAMLINEEGINLDTWQEDLKNGETKTEETWFNKVKELNLQNSVFVDVTANAEVAQSYSSYLKQSIAVVACNKIACSSTYSKYSELKENAKQYNAPFLFETNVGAGLPIINTLNNLVDSGDKITTIKAVLSGSLNFIFNNFNGETSFYDVVKEAEKQGYTEPDPRIDLSGVDVARKILILARESGYKLDIEDIENNSFLPKASLEADTVADFYETLKTEAAHFNKLAESAKNNNCRLKYVAEFVNGKASVGLQEIPVDHPFYNLDGKDNIVLFFTERYIDQPLLIKGAGAGAEVTASGLFGDIISLGK